MNDKQPDTVQQAAKPTQPTGIARRRLLRAGLAATPVILTLSGRSAMAAVSSDDCAKGLSPMAWNSLAPDGTNCRVNSHTVTVNTLGQPISYWQTRALKDPDFGSIKFSAVFPSSGNNTAMKKILTNRSENLNDHYCAAYFNTQAFADSYAITLTELQNLYHSKQLTPRGKQLSNPQIKAFLAQTWS